MKKSTLSLVISLLASVGLGTAHADPGDDLVTWLTNLYNDTRSNCGTRSQPAFLCSGVTFRATYPSRDYDFWSISPTSKQSGGVSASYLRKDSKFNRLASFLKSGFIFDTIINSRISGGVDYDVLCFYPQDGGSNFRDKAGCGDSRQSTNRVEKYCSEEGVNTAEQWLAHYQKIDEKRYWQCAIDVRDSSKNTAEAFYEGLKVMPKIPKDAFKEQNELRIAAWKENPPKEPPIVGVFYTTLDGLEDARLYQKQYYDKTREHIPAIQMKLPASPSEDAKFIYDSKLQLTYPTSAAPTCPKYVESATWQKRPDPGFGKEIWSLSVVPTKCGREIKDDQTNHMFNELAAAQYLDERWSGNKDNPSTNIASIRRQLTCHFLIAPNKKEWNLEPSRPYVSIQQSKAEDCNNVP
ncbi:DUF2599 domain-containing protein [Pseudomonas wadenswilerensis]